MAMASEQRSSFVVDYDMRNDEVQIYDRENARVAAIFYRYGAGVARAASAACEILNLTRDRENPTTAATPAATDGE